MSDFDDFVLRGGQKITAGQMAEFERKIPLLLVKAETIEAPDFPNLRDQITFLARFTEDTLDGVHNATDLGAVAEAVFALGYLLQDVDIIPDTVPGKGFADDSAVIRAVLRGHPAEFAAYAASKGVSAPPEEP